MDTARTEPDTTVTQNINTAITSRIEPLSTDDTHTMQRLVVSIPLQRQPRVHWADSTNSAVRRAISELLWESDVRENIEGICDGSPRDYFLSLDVELPSETVPRCSPAPKWRKYLVGYVVSSRGKIVAVWFRCGAIAKPYIRKINVKASKLPDDVHMTPKNAISYLFSLYEAKIERTTPLIDEFNRYRDLFSKDS
jgi:hypothetical protein